MGIRKLQMPGVKSYNGISSSRHCQFEQSIIIWINGHGTQ